MHGLFASNLYNPISILAPAFNEESTVVESVHSLLQLRYPNFEIIVINDGSKDQTMQVLIEEFELERVERYVPLILDHKPIRGIYRSRRFNELIVVDKENGRKADALNAGINVCRNDLFCAIDADCVLEPDVLQNMLRCFIEDETTIAVGGIVRVANDCLIEGNEIKEIRMPKSFLARIQVVEYLRAFLFGRVGWDYMDSLLIISGAFGIFDRNAVLRVGGYLHDTVGEDMELVVRMHRYHRENTIPYRVRFLPEPVCWTEVPEDINVLSRQRNRWHRGLADTIWRHRKMMFNPKYGRLGMFAMPFFFFFELLSPIIELLGYIAVILMVVLGLFNPTFAALIFAATVLLGVVLSVASVLCEEYTFRRYSKVKDVLIMIGFAVIENFGFRQVHALWRFKGLVDFLKGNKEWGAMTRKGFGEKQPKADAPVVPKDKPAVVTVVDGASEVRVGQKVENFDVYSQKAEQIIGKYAGRKTVDGEYKEDNSFKNAYNRRSWTKTTLPVGVLLGSLLLIGIWITANTGQKLAITSTDFTQTSIEVISELQLFHMPVFANGLVIVAGKTDVVHPARPNDVALSSGLSLNGIIELLNQIYIPPSRGNYFIAEHRYVNDSRVSNLFAYKQTVSGLGFQFFARPAYETRFGGLSWNVGFGPFSTFRTAIQFAELALATK
jgi:cellulose synthase/poly-beta-1,6-N-acetylglucosamine synthase-like glycosyltransferase